MSKVPLYAAAEPHSQTSQKTYDFYANVLSLTHLPQYDHYNVGNKGLARVFYHQPTNLTVEVRDDSTMYRVGSRQDLERWAAWFDANCIKHGPVVAGREGFTMSCDDPEGRTLRFYFDAEEKDWADVGRDLY